MLEHYYQIMILWPCHSLRQNDVGIPSQGIAHRRLSRMIFDEISSRDDLRTDLIIGNVARVIVMRSSAFGKVHPR